MTELSRSVPELTLLKAARGGDEAAFAQLTEPYRRELQLHCYRMLGSLHDAEDAMQETLVRAWRMLGGYEGRAPLRAWLYRIATNACLTALSRRGPGADRAHMTPYPDTLLDELVDPGPGPAMTVESREGVELAFLAAIDVLPPRQRAVLVLREALGWSAAEVADLLETTVAGVNSALQRARATIDAAHAAGRLLPSHAPASEAAQRSLLARYVDAWNSVDHDRLAALLAEDAVLTMPPEPIRIVGRSAVTEFFATVPAGGRLDRIRLVPASANGQPALAAYISETGTGPYVGYGLMVFTVRGQSIAAITGFGDPALLGSFGLPGTIDG